MSKEQEEKNIIDNDAEISIKIDNLCKNYKMFARKRNISASNGKNNKNIDFSTAFREYNIYL